MSHYLAVSYIVVLVQLSTIPGIARAADSTTPSASPSASPSPTELTKSAPKNSCKDQPECVELIKRARDLESARNNTEALDVYKNAYNTFSDQRILLRIGLLLNKLEQYPQAIGILSRYVESATDERDSTLMRMAHDGIAEAERKRLRDVTISVDRRGAGVIRAVNNEYHCASKTCSFLLRNVAQSPLTLTTLVAEAETPGTTVSWSAPCRTTAEAPKECLLAVYKDTSIEVQFKRSRVRTTASIISGIGGAVALVTGSILIAKPEMDRVGPGAATLGLGSGLGALSIALALK
jgi:tetratricopeptide (TPR) repeat protein